MFGFLRPSCQSRKYRQIYAAICSHQRRQYGTIASILISYEAVFLYHLAVELGVAPQPSAETPTCCRLRNDWPNRWGLNLKLADYCTSFAILLAQTKLEDDVRDSRSLVPRLGGWMLKRAFRKNSQYLDNVAPGLSEQVDHQIQSHLELESAQSHYDAQLYSRPTANAFAAIFETFGELCAQQVHSNTGTHFSKAQSPNPSNLPTQFKIIGQKVGRGILISDCLFDFQKDKRRGEFNPISSTEHFASFREQALRAWTEAGWAVDSLITESAQTVRILRSAFERTERFNIHTKCSNQFKKIGIPTFSRGGFCDCDCGCCCEGCGDPGCCGSCDCCNTDVEVTPACPCLYADCCCFFADCHLPNKRSNQRISKAEPQPIQISDPIVGQVGIADVHLNPTGYVSVNGKRFPAQSDGGQWIAKGTKVEVLENKAFGLIVREL